MHTNKTTQCRTNVQTHTCCRNNINLQCLVTSKAQIRRKNHLRTSHLNQSPTSIRPYRSSIETTSTPIAMTLPYRRLSIWPLSSTSSSFLTSRIALKLVHDPKATRTETKLVTCQFQWLSTWWWSPTRSNSSRIWLNSVKLLKVVRSTSIACTAWRRLSRARRRRRRKGRKKRRTWRSESKTFQGNRNGEMCYSSCTTTQRCWCSTCLKRKEGQAWARWCSFGHRERMAACRRISS